MPGERPSLLRAGRAMAVATCVSRATGFARTLALVAALGLGTRLLDTYTVANTLPLVIYELVVGGALASVIVPLLIRATTEESGDGDLYAQRLLSLVVYGLGVVVLAAMLLAPQIVHFYAPGFSPGQSDAAITFTRFFLPQILFYGVSTVLTAILNVRGRLATPLWAPVANNVIVILTVLTYLVIGGSGQLERLTPAESLVLTVGTTAGVAAYMAILALASRRAGFRLRLRADFRGIGVRRIAGMAGWTVASVLADQAVLAILIRLATASGPGAASAYTNAWALFQLPYAVITVSIITGVLPRMSRAAAERDLTQLTTDLSHSLRLSGIVLMPIAAGLVVLGPQITTVLYAHGNATPAATHLTGSVLAAYGLALVPFAYYQIMLRVFYALHDTRTPTLINIAVSAITITACVTVAHLLPGPNLIVALAVCSGVSYTISLIVITLLLRRRIGRIDGHRLLGTHTRMLAATGAAALITAVIVHAMSSTVGNDWTGSVATAFTAAAAGVGCYALAAWRLGITEINALTAALRISRT